MFCIADFLAIHYQKLTYRILRTTHILAFLMGFMFILYSDYKSQPVYMVLFLAFFAFAAGAQQLAKRKGWHRKYLDYRTLAEGLRVQFYLAAAGITSDNESKFTHDNFLQTQDPELGWIRNVMRVAGTRCDADRLVTPEGLEFTMKEWVGNEESGQLGYYQRKAQQWLKKNRNTERLSQLSLVVSVLVICVILVAGNDARRRRGRPAVRIHGCRAARLRCAPGLCAEHGRERVDQAVRFHEPRFLQCEASPGKCRG